MYSSLKTPADHFNFTYRNVSVTHEEFDKFSKEFSEKIAKSSDVIVNSAASKSVFGFANILASLQAGSNTISAVLTDPGEACRQRNAKILILTEDKIKNIFEPFEVEKIVLGVEKKEEVEGALKALESKGVKAKSVLAYNLSNLSNLA